MTQKNRIRHHLVCLGMGIFLTGSVGCQGTEAPAPRDTASGKQESEAATAAGNTLHQHHERPDSAASGKKVSIDNFTFHPETLEVPTGSKVIWVNGDDVPHTVRSVDDLFRSGTLDTDDVYERVFSEPGTYEYYCGVHRHMTGKVIVK